MNVFFAYAAETLGVTVRVNPSYVAEQSNPARSSYAWTYHVRIENHGAVPVQLVSRHWIITDGHGAVEEVRGPGVVGETPLIGPGQAFDYVSGCTLQTPSGSMRGSFQMRLGDNLFNAAIPAFGLAVPRAAGRRA